MFKIFVEKDAIPVKAVSSIILGFFIIIYDNERLYYSFKIYLCVKILGIIVSSFDNF